jgi:hypothetical protein
MVTMQLIGGIVVVIIILIAGYFLLPGNHSNTRSSTFSTTQYYTYSTTGVTTSIGVSTNSTTVNSTTTIHPMNQAGVVVFNVTEKDYSITPNTFVINVNQTAYFNVTNDGTYSHDLGIYGLGSQWGTPVLNGGGGKGVFRFNATGPGNYTLYSNVGNDRNMGMVGTLTIR